METSENELLIRPLAVGDFTFVRELAAQQPNFTIPPPFVLWLFLKVRTGLSLVALNHSGDLLGYVLAMPVEDPPNSVYVWQLATTKGSKKAGAGMRLLEELKKALLTADFATVIFSASEGSAELRAIRQSVSQLVQREVKMVRRVPLIVAPAENEYQIRLN